MKRTALAIATSLVVLAGAASAAWAAPAAPRQAADGCWEPAKTLYFPSGDNPRWSYTERLEWCLEGGEVVLREWPQPDVHFFDDTCYLYGDPERVEKTGDGDSMVWTSIGTIVCHDGAEPYQLNPWMSVTGDTDGESPPDGGIEGSPYE